MREKEHPFQKSISPQPPFVIRVNQTITPFCSYPTYTSPLDSGE